MKKYYLAVLALTAAFMSCEKKEVVESKDLDQDKIHSIYDVEYHEYTDETIAYAKFTNQSPTGPYLKLSSPASIELNGIKLSPHVKTNIYKTELNGFVGVFTWNYRDLDGNIWQQIISMQPTDVVYPDTIYKSNDLTLNWTSAPLNPGEQILIHISQGDNTYKQLEERTPGATSITIPASTFEDFENGQVNISAQRKFTHQVFTNANNAGATIRSTYSETIALKEITD